MIQDEILAIGRDQADDGSALNAIADEFRSGRNVAEVLVLLDASNAELVSIGAWILGELRFELYDSPEFVRRLNKLLEYDDPGVRLTALGALFPALGQDAATQKLLGKLRHDPNKGVRMSAEAATAQLMKDR